MIHIFEHSNQENIVLDILNTPMRARSLASLYGCFLEQNPNVLIVGDPDLTNRYISSIRANTIFAMRVWECEKIDALPAKLSEVYIQEPPNQEWFSSLDFCHTAQICVIRHALPVGSKLKEVQETISPEAFSRLRPGSDFADLIQRVQKQPSSKNPISLIDLSVHMCQRGWYYLCDLCGYRDFVHHSDHLVSFRERSLHDECTGLLWRDSIFVHSEPKWVLQPERSFQLLWRYASEKNVDSRWIYQTIEGIQIGIHHNKSLSEYRSWKDLCAVLPEYIESFVQSGLLNLVEDT